VGVVVKAKNATGRVCALKILRTDANRPSMEAEFKLTTMANRIGVGVRVLEYTKDFLVMDLLEHIELHQWLCDQKGRGKAARTREMVHMILNQCRKLDIINLDHGQLSNLRKHVVVARDKPWIIDFESAGKERKPKNVTTAAQYLFVGSKISPLVRRTLGITDTGGLLGLLRAYKQTLSDISYAKILESLRIPAG
jgi:putative serine/threonine protein kinase